MDALLKDVLNRVGTKAIVIIIAMFFLFSLAMKEGLAISPLWFAGGIVILALAFLAARMLTNDKEDLIKAKNGGTNEVK